MREKINSRFLLLTALTGCVCGTLEVDVARPFYQAEEKKSVTLEWKFNPKPDPSLKHLHIVCDLYRYYLHTVLFHLQRGVEVPLEEAEFSGRVQYEKDVLREGRIRFQVSSLRMNDSGWYMCEVLTQVGTNLDKCYLNVTAASIYPRPDGNAAVSLSMIGLSCVLLLTVFLMGWV